MNKRTIILNALEALIISQKGNTCSVSDIAKQAGIGKGSIYYYFASKEEIFDALVERIYADVIRKCKETVEKSELPATQKIALLLQTYYSSSVEIAVDRYLHEPQNAYVHQKSLAMILKSLTPIVTKIIEQGIQEKIYSCSYPREFSELILSELCFVFDPGIFTWAPEEMKQKLHGLAEFMEKGLSAPQGCFDFLLAPFTQTDG